MTAIAIDVGHRPATRSRPTAPQGYPLVGMLPHVRRDPLGFFAQMARDYGGAVTIDLGLDKVLMLTEPEYIKHVLQDNYENYHKSKFYRPLKPIFGDGIITAEDDAWLHQRLATAKSFHGAYIRRMTDDMTIAVDDMLKRWDAQQRQGQGTLEISSEMAHVTLDILCRTLFGVQLAGEHRRVYDALTTTLKDAERRIWSAFPLPSWAPTAGNLKARRAIAELETFIERAVAEHTAAPRAKDNLLSILIETQGSGVPGGGSPKLLRDQMLTFLMAGHETTANGLAWTWYLLSKNPQAARGVKDEIERVLQGRVPTFEDLPKLTYTKMVFDEALRILPPVWTISRCAMGDDAIDGIDIPKGTSVMICPYALHRRADLWSNPEGFDPERFAPGSEKLRPRHAYIPFGGGPRTCLGNRFAATEALLVLAMTLQRHDLELVPGQRVEPEPMITLRPRDGILMRMREAVYSRTQVAVAAQEMAVA